MRILVYGVLAVALARFAVTARATARAVEEMGAARWALHEDPFAAARALCAKRTAGASVIDSPCPLNLAWRAASGAYEDVCAALPHDTAGAGFRLPRYYRMAPRCLSHLSTTIFR